MKSKCPVFKATGRRGKNECSVCPFSANCPEDRFNDAIVEVMEIIGDYLNAKRKDGTDRVAR